LTPTPAQLATIYSVDVDLGILMMLDAHDLESPPKATPPACASPAANAFNASGFRCQAFRGFVVQCISTGIARFPWPSTPISADNIQ